MIYNKQLFRHDPDNKVFGDCHRTALACMLDLQPSEVPHFYESGDPLEFDRLLKEYLTSINLCEVNFPFLNELDAVLNHMGFLNKNVYYILGGTSPRGTSHSVVACGGEIIHDPHPDGGNLVCPMSDGYYWITVYVPNTFERRF